MNVKKVLVLFLGTAIFLSLAFVLKHFAPFTENAFYDIAMSLKPVKAQNSVVIVGIDSKSVSSVGMFPWPRSTIAALVERISSAGPSVVALDFRFPRKEGDADNDSLDHVFGRTAGLVLPFHAGSITNQAGSRPAIIPNAAFDKRFVVLLEQKKLEDIGFYVTEDIDIGDTLFYRHAARSGFLNVSTQKSNQKITEMIHVIKAGNEYFPSFAIGVSAAHMYLRPDELRLSGEGAIYLRDKKVPLTDYAGSTVLNFRGRRGTITTVSASDVLDGSVDRSLFSGKPVFIGITDASVFASECFLTPVGAQFPGVEIWATATADILENAWLDSTHPLYSPLSWIVALIMFPLIPLVLPGRRKILIIALSSCGLIASFCLWFILTWYGRFVWSPAPHVYAWLFSILWLIVQKADPTLVEIERLDLEPASTDADVVAAPTDAELIEKVPDLPTASYVATKLRNGEIVSTDTATEATATNKTAKQLRSLAGGSIIRPLGSGGMADVYLIWNPRLEVYRAVKVIKPGLSEHLLDRFETEIRIFANLSHPNIVQCFSAGEWHGLPYLEIEYIPGASMDEVLRKCTLLSAEQTLAVGVLICRALSYAHTQVVSVYGRPYKGVIHRDLKPANIMLSRSGKIKLTDFGIARPQSVSLHTADATKIVGTFPYLAPEQLDGKDITIKTDLYALGATLYELVTGDRVFPQSDITTLITAKSKGQFKSLRDSSLVPGPMAGIIEKALALNPADRYESAAAMGKDLERTLHSIARDGKAPFLPNLVSRFFG